MGAEGTRITLPDASQDGLQQLLGQLRDARVPLVSVNQSRTDLEEVFLQLIHEGKEHAA